MIDQPALYKVEPVLTERLCGGWLATTPKGWPLCIGVVGDSKEHAQANFSAALIRWQNINIVNAQPKATP